MTEPDYVTHAAWTAPAGRPDAIDEIADQFERRGATTTSGAEAFWTAGAQAAWPSRPSRPRELRLAG